jgi:secreted PhoX family phosphatase
VFGVLPDGTSRQLPRLGRFAWENTKPAYNRTDTTLVIGTEDTAHGQLHIYEGAKRADGNPFDRAGLTNGVRYVLDLVDEEMSSDADFRDAYGKGTPAEFDLAEVGWDQSGAGQNDEAEAEGLTLFRIEDGSWQPRRPEIFYFTTTEGGAGASRERDGGGLWKLTFEDIEQPRRGGTIELLLDGSEAPHLNAPDNVDIDTSGNLLILEDPDENPHLARIVAYDTATGARGVVARFDPERFGADSASLITIDEEASGIIDAERVIGPGWFLLTAQVHEPSADPANVELGQLLAMKVDSFRNVYD